MFTPSFKRAILFVIICLILGAAHAEAREIVDMAGRTVSVPDTITKAYGSSPPATDMIYAIDPGLIAGMNAPLYPGERRFLIPSMQKLPIMGGWFGQGRTPNLETILEVKPDVMVVWLWKRSTMADTIERTAARLNLPMVYIKLDHLSDYPEAFRFMGKLLHREERARALSEYASRVLAETEAIAAAIPEGKKVAVYFAEAPDGLSTECDKSLHTELINLAGGKNIYQCEPQDAFGMERISIEQVMAADPEVILAMEKEFVDHVYTDAKWQSIRAVRNKRVHLIPNAPFNWFTRPPSYMRLIGIKWVANILYPDRFPFDAARETREFYSLFLGIQLNEPALREVLQQ